MTDTMIYVATIWDDTTSFGSPLERRWFSTDETANDWIYNQMSRCDWWHVEPVESGDEPGEKEGERKTSSPRRLRPSGSLRVCLNGKKPKALMKRTAIPLKTTHQSKAVRCAVPAWT
jgi:hypothetical protein